MALPSGIERQLCGVCQFAAVVVGVDHRRGRRAAVVARARAERAFAEEGQPPAETPVDLKRSAVVTVEERLGFVLLRIAVLAEDLALAEEGPVIEQRLVDAVGLAVDLEQQALDAAAVGVVRPECKARAEAEEHPRGDGHVHERIDVAQVLAFGVVGRRVVETDARGEPAGQVAADGPVQAVALELLVARMVGGVLHQVEGRLRRVDEVGAGHPLAREAVVAHRTGDNRACAQPVIRRGFGPDAETVVRIVVVLQSAVLAGCRERHLRESPAAEGHQPGGIPAPQPSVGKFSIADTGPVGHGRGLSHRGGAFCPACDSPCQQHGSEDRSDSRHGTRYCFRLAFARWWKSLLLLFVSL